MAKNGSKKKSQRDLHSTSIPMAVVDEKSPQSVGKNPITRVLLRHYGNTSCTISAEQLEQEKYLFYKIKFNPWILLPAAVLVQFCCGSIYTWSVFNIPIDQAITGNPHSAQAPVTFYISVGTFGVSAATMGPWLERNGPKKALILSASLYYLANLISALAIFLKEMWLLYFGYGIIGGFSLALGYISPVSTLQKWFPRKRGLVAGFAVCGCGIGTIVIGKVILPLIHLVGLPLTFVVLGSIYFLAMISVAFLFRVPPPGYSHANLDFEDLGNNESIQASPEIKLTLIESLKSFDYFLLYLIFFANALFGVLVMSRLSNMITELYLRTPDHAATIVAIDGSLNLFGRLFFSTVSDKIGRKTCFILMLGTQTIVLAAFPYYTENKIYWAFLSSMFFLTVCYGGGFAVIPAFLADMFGSSNIAACHGIILTAWSIAGVAGGLTFTAIFNNQIASGKYTTEDAYPYVINSYWVLPIVIVGLLAAIFVRTSLKDRLLPPVEGQWFRFRMFGKVVRIKRVATCCPQMEILSSEEYDKEWEEYLEIRSSKQQYFSY